MSIQTPIPPANPYALGPQLYTAVIGVIVTLILTEFLPRIARRARDSAKGWGKRLYQQQVRRSLEHVVRLRLGGDSRADVLAEWQRLKLDRLAALVCASAAGVAMIAAPLPGVRLACLLVFLLALWGYTSLAEREEDYAFAYRSDATPEVREKLGELIEARVQQLVADRPAKLDGASAPGLAAVRDPAV